MISAAQAINIPACESLEDIMARMAKTKNNKIKIFDWPSAMFSRRGWYVNTMNDATQRLMVFVLMLKARISRKTDEMRARVLRKNQSILAVPKLSLVRGATQK